MLKSCLDLKDETSCSCLTSMFHVEGRQVQALKNTHIINKIVFGRRGGTD